MVGVAPDQGAVGETWLFRRRAKMPRVQATYSVLFCSGGDLRLVPSRQFLSGSQECLTVIVCPLRSAQVATVAC